MYHILHAAKGVHLYHLRKLAPASGVRTRPMQVAAGNLGAAAARQPSCGERTLISLAWCSSGPACI